MSGDEEENDQISSTGRMYMRATLLMITVTVLLLLPALSLAASPRPGGYVSGFIGATIPRDADVHTSQFGIDGSFENFDDQVAFDPGLNIGGTGGYDFGFLRLEGEMSYKYSEIKSITDTTDGFHFGNPDGNISAFAMLANAFIDLHNAGPVTPYFGGGAGFAGLHLSDTFGTDITAAGAERVLIYPDDDDMVFAYQAGAGIDIALNRNLSLDLGYRYFGTSKGRFGRGLDPTTELKYESHNATIGVRVKF